MMVSRVRRLINNNTGLPGILNLGVYYVLMNAWLIQTLKITANVKPTDDKKHSLMTKGYQYTVKNNDSFG